MTATKIIEARARALHAVAHKANPFSNTWDEETEADHEMWREYARATVRADEALAQETPA